MSQDMQDKIWRQPDYVFTRYTLGAVPKHVDAVRWTLAGGPIMFSRWIHDIRASHAMRQKIHMQIIDDILAGTPA